MKMLKSGNYPEGFKLSDNMGQNYKDLYDTL